MEDSGVRLGRTLLIVFLAAAIGGSTALASPGKLLKKSSDNGLPIAYVRGDAKNPKTLLVRIKGKPQQPIEVLWQVTCVKGNKEKVPGGEFIVQPTATKKLKKGFKRPEDCTIDVQGAYEDAAVSGTVKLELFSRGKKSGKKK